MNHVLAVRIVQRLGSARHERHHGFRRQQPSAIGVMAQVLAAQIFHRDVGESLIFARVVDGHDRGMIEPAGHLRFAEEPRAGFLQILFLEFIGQRDGLDRDDAIDVGIAAQVHDAHRAFAQFTLDLVAAELAAQRSRLARRRRDRR